MDKLVQTLRGIVPFEAGEELDQVMDTVIGLLRTGFEEIEELLVVA
jgi:hypothetical protein